MRAVPPTNTRTRGAEVRANTLRLDQRTLAALIEKLETTRGGKTGARRRYSRFTYCHADVQVVLTHPGGTSSSLTLCSRDISSGGLSLLHNSYIHKGTLCNVMLDRPGNGKVTIPGKVVRCVQLAGLVHELGIAFNTRVSLRELLCPDPLDEFFSLEHVDPAELKGRLLHVDATNMGRRLLKAFANETSLEIEQAGTLAQGIEAGKKPFDIIVSEYTLPDGTAADLVEALRVKQINIPVMVLVNDSTTETRENIRRSQPAGVLRKPVTQDRLLRSLAEVLLLARPTDAPSNANTNTTRSALIRVFLDELLTQARELEAALSTDRTEECLRICRELSGAAPTLGFALVATAAENAIRAIISGGAAREATPEINELATTCRRAAA